VIDDRVLDCFFDCEIKRFKKTNFGTWRAYSCAFLAVDLLFVAEIPRNAATIKYRFLFNQVSVLQSKRQRTQRAEQVKKGAHELLDTYRSGIRFCMAARSVAFGFAGIVLLCEVRLVCRCSSCFFALVRHKAQQSHGVSTFLRKGLFIGT